MQVAGVDACPKGRWAVVILRDGRVDDLAIADSFRSLLHAYPQAPVIAVDIPIGMPPPYPRRADVQARKFVGERRSAVFPTYPREVYEAPSHAAAVEVARSLIGKGVSIQAYAIGARILEVDRTRVRRVHEVHPEVSFAELSSHGRLASKHKPEGPAQRRELLETVGITLPRRITRATESDLLDAAVVAWTAWRIARGVARTLPADPERGEPCIWF